MAFNHTLSAILRGHWLISDAWAKDHMPAVIMLLEGKNVSFSSMEMNSRERVSKLEFIDPISMKKYPAKVYDYRSDTFVPNPNIPTNSIGVISICGPITKYDGECGELGAISISNMIADINKRDNVDGIVLSIDSPGGEARAASILTSAIQNSKKPVLSHVSGMAASLAVFITSASKEVYLSNKMDEMGSVGSFWTMYDFSKYLENAGITVHEIYAPQSTDKNSLFNEALSGNYEQAKEYLKLHVDEFISFVKNSRGEKAAKSADQWNSGKMFFANEAIKLGLADGILPIEKVISKAAWLSKRNK